ncbi:phosphoglycolate phosphatase [Hypericibacter adhaerens]|jgi:phosphoglycolate phosphatase|uniref:phosphoglycolate phosphatase n=1 Tax=Hypericibacter adhaerens TaxID=2602016 RepID=A0A5J6MX17_9PROT|nr:HAD family hydrolase [Hypericibacter adhaerens]QEX21657.1 phosphoglycolate phosphatase [Hypericibacter adhaerens]
MLPTVRGVLFDKDGTLFDFNATWMPLYLETADEVAGGDKALALRLLVESGYDEVTRRLDPRSPLAAGTNQQIAEIWARVAGGEWSVQRLTRRFDANFAKSMAMRPTPVTDLAVLFGHLKRKGLRIGVATMDSHAAARAAVETFELVGLVDFVCGYDSGHGHKPGPGMVEAFCRAVELPARDVAVVGDTPHDMHMARAAGAGLALGVLTGVSPREVLADHADRVLASIAELETLLA